MVSPSAMVSVIIATNRDSPYLAAAVDSVCAQSHHDWELLIVDNGVPDRAALDAVTARAPRSRVLHVPPPVTVSLARNTGAAAASGDLLVFLDDDDVWHPERLERQVRALADHPDAPASYCGGWHLDAAGVTIGDAWPATPATALDMLTGGSRMPHICGAMMIRRSAFQEIGGFSPELTMLEDFELAVRLLGRGEFVCVPNQLVGYRRHDRNATSTQLANVRVRREAMDRILARHIWAADVRGDIVTARALREHRSRERHRAAGEAGAATLTALRRRRFVIAAEETRWGIARGPGAYLAHVARRLTGAR